MGIGIKQTLHISCDKCTGPIINVLKNPVESVEEAGKILGECGWKINAKTGECFCPSCVAKEENKTDVYNAGFASGWLGGYAKGVDDTKEDHGK